jgi:hypothetical protein
LGLGSPLNLATLSSAGRASVRQGWWLFALLALITPAFMLALDQLLFNGVSLSRLAELGSQPLGVRLGILLYSAVTEEILYRLGVATLFAWLTLLALPQRLGWRKAAAQWVGIVIAALLFGLAHVANLPDLAHPVLRAVTLNGVAGLVLGWIYFWRGLEAAIFTHLVAILILYVAVPPLL